MKRLMMLLTSAVHIYTTQLERSPIAVFIGDELVGSGLISEITDLSVRIGDEWYVREVCTFIKYES